MLWTIILILLVLWLLGVISGSAGGYVHILLAVLIIVLIINYLPRGPRA